MQSTPNSWGQMSEFLLLCMICVHQCIFQSAEVCFKCITSTYCKSKGFSQSRSFRYQSQCLYNQNFTHCHCLLNILSLDFGSHQPCVPAWRCCLMTVTAGSSWHRQRDDLALHPTAGHWSSRNVPARTVAPHGTAATLKKHIHWFRGWRPAICFLLLVTCCTILSYTTS